MKLLRYILLPALFLMACSPVKRMTRLAVSHPEAGAAVFAKLYPVKQSITILRDTLRDTTLLPGEIKFVDCDSAVTAKAASGDTGKTIVYIECPPQQLIHDKIYVDSIVETENTAAIDALKADVQKLQDKNYQLKTTKKYLWIACAVLAVIVIARYVVRTFF